jgi:hypothetical protein
VLLKLDIAIAGVRLSILPKLPVRSVAPNCQRVEIG